MKSRSAFTLVELVVIIMILGILAGVAAPKLLKTSGTATDNGLKQSLRIVRDAIEHYSAENNGVYPGCTGDGSDFRAFLSKYVRGEFPISPVGAKNFDVAPTSDDPPTADPSPTTGWKYNPATGAFICNSADVSSTDGKTYAEF